MKRTYFVPMCVLAGIMICSSIAGFVLVVMFDATLDQADELFISKYKEPGSYQALYSEAVDLRQKLSFQRKDKSFFTTAAGLTWGLLLVWWAFDRRRLIRRCQQSAPQKTEAAT